MGKQRVVAWVHIMDNTDGIPENEPITEVTLDEDHPFGVPGENFSGEYKVRSFPLYGEYSIAAMQSMATRASRDYWRRREKKTTESRDAK